MAGNEWGYGAWGDGEWGDFSAGMGVPASLTVAAATASAAGEAVTLDAASLFIVTEATAPAAGQAVTLTGQGRLPVTEATSPAAGQNVNFSAAGVFAAGTATADAAADGRFVQLVRSASDVTDGSWTGQDAGTALATYIDEATANDSDYIQSSQSPNPADEAKIRFAPLTDPAVSTGHIVRYRYGKDVAGGDTVDLQVILYDSDGTTVIASQSHVDIPAGWTDGSFTLSEAEANAITGYAAGLVVGFAAVTP